MNCHCGARELEGVSAVSLDRDVAHTVVKCGKFQKIFGNFTNGDVLIDWDTDDLAIAEIDADGVVRVEVTRTVLRAAPQGQFVNVDFPCRFCGLWRLPTPGQVRCRCDG